jgi:hypothetical protein
MITTPDTPVEDLCVCGRFHLWYVGDDVIVCRCGHEDAEHLYRQGSCTGLVEWFRG